jgi:hypothetical protein
MYIGECAWAVLYLTILVIPRPPLLFWCLVPRRGSPSLLLLLLLPLPLLAHSNSLIRWHWWPDPQLELLQKER